MTAKIIVVIDDAKARAISIFCCHRTFPCTASNQAATSNFPSCALHCYGVPPNRDHAHRCHFCCRSIDIGDDTRHPPPLLRARRSTLVASFRAEPTPISLETLVPFPATNRARRLRSGG